MRRIGFAILLAIVVLSTAAATYAAQPGSRMKLTLPGKSSINHHQSVLVITDSLGSVTTIPVSQLSTKPRVVASMRLSLPPKPGAKTEAFSVESGYCYGDLAAWTNNNGTIGVLGDMEGCGGDVQESQQLLYLTTCKPLLWGCTWQADTIGGPLATYYILQPNTYYYDPQSGEWDGTPYLGLHCYGNWRYRANDYGWIANQYGTSAGTMTYTLCGS